MAGHLSGGGQPGDNGGRGRHRGGHAHGVLSALSGCWKQRYHALLGVDKSWANGNVVAQKLNGHSEAVRCTAYVEAGSDHAPQSLLLTGSHDGSVKLWDRRSGSMLQWLWPAGLQGSTVLKCALISVEAQQRILAVHRTGEIVSWDSSASRRWSAKLPVAQVGWLADVHIFGGGRRAMSLGDDGVAHEWVLEHAADDGDEEGEKGWQRDRFGAGATNAALLGDNGGGAGKGKNRVGGDHVGELRSVDGTIISRHVRMLQAEHASRLTAVVPSDYTSLVAVASQDSKVHLVDSSTGQISRSFSGHTGGVGCLRMQHNDQPDELHGPFSLFSGSADTTVRLWDTRMHTHNENTGDAAVVLRGHVGAVNTIGTFGEYRVVSGGSDSTVICWDIRKQQCLYRIHVQGNGVGCLDFDGLSVACGTMDGSISLLNFYGDEERHALLG